MTISLQQALAGAGFWNLWNAADVGVIALVLAASYLVVTGPLRDRLGWGRAPTKSKRTYFLLGCLALYVGLGSPLDWLSDNYLMSAHMLEHMLLIFACAPLFLAGTPDWLARAILGRGFFRWLWTKCVNPAAALGIFISILSVWHLPYLYNLTLTHEAVHFTEHAMFMVIGLIVWWPLLSPLPELPRLQDSAKLVYLFVEEVLMTVPFAIITFAPAPFYTFYVHQPRLWGLSPLDDQIIGGIIMRLASALSMGVEFAKSFFRWFAGYRGIDPVPDPAPHTPLL